MTTLNAVEAKKHFSDLLSRVADDGETILITRRGKPMAKLVPPTSPLAESPKRMASVVKESWGALRLGPTQVREILSDEDGFLDA